MSTETSDQSIISAARKMLSSYPGLRGQPQPSVLQKIQDSLWWVENHGLQKISNVTRFKIVERLEDVQFWCRFSICEFLGPFLPISIEYGMPGISNDGKQHYANEEGIALPNRCAEMVVEDCRIRMLGYEIYRFCGVTFLNSQKAIERITMFF